MRFTRKTAFLFSLLAILLVTAEAQPPERIDFYGVISPDADKNMIKMTEDLYYTQLKDFSPFVNDFREKTKSGGMTPDDIHSLPTDEGAVSFYAVITRNGDALSKWECTLCLKRPDEEKTFLFSKEYDSYYKILMESKTVLNAMLGKAMRSDGNAKKPEITETAAEKTQEAGVENTVSEKPHLQGTSGIDISGTWTGGQDIAKAVIMKGGRGFIIFKNGATMNISITTEETPGLNPTVRIRQIGHSNASYFPEMERNVALEAAKNADPIEWELELTAETTLTGNKKTLVPDETGSQFQSGLIPVEWTKK